MANKEELLARLQEEKPAWKSGTYPLHMEAIKF